MINQVQIYGIIKQMKCLSSLARILFSALLTILIVSKPTKQVWAIALTGSDSDNQALDNTESIINGPGVQLDSNRARLAGLQTSILHSTSYSQKHLVRAKVINPLPLLTLKQQISNATQERKLSQQQLTLAQQSLQRAQRLQDAGIGQPKQVAILETDLLTRQVAMQQITSKLRQLKLQCQQQWGETIAQQIQSPSALIDKLESGEQVLLLITLPSDVQTPRTINSMIVRPAGDKNPELTAKLVSASPYGIPDSIGATYFFSAAKHAAFRLDTVIDGWINAHAKPQQGIMIPDSAIIWHAGQAWVFIETGPFQYLRRAVNNALTVDQHWFVRSGFSAGEKLVTQGAALLLSEEFRWQIPEEDEDEDEEDDD